MKAYGRKDIGRAVPERPPRRLRRPVRMYNQKVFALAYGFVRDRAAADDFTQEVFLKAYQALPSFRAESGFGTWIYRIAVNHVKDYLRKSSLRRTVSLDDIGEGPLAVDGGAEDRVRQGEEEISRREVFRVLETLPPKYRMILTLRTWKGSLTKKSPGSWPSPRGRWIPASSGPAKCCAKK